VIKTSWLVALALTICRMVTAQNVTISVGEWQDKGILLLPATSPDFTKLVSTLAPAGTPSDFAQVAPYSFVVQNLTAKTVIAFSVRWKCVDAKWRTTNADRLWAHLQAPSGGTAIPSGGESAVTPALNLGAAMKAGKLDRELAGFGGKQSIVVSLEAIVFDDGTALGPDSNNAIPRLQARLAAERSVLTGAQNAWQLGGTAAATSYLQQLVDAAPASQGRFAIINSSSSAAAYSLALSDAEVEFAKLYLVMLAKAPSGFYNFASRRLNRDFWPNIHR
jgi:hypothetical protein